MKFLITVLLKHWLTWLYVVVAYIIYNAPVEEFCVVSKQSTLVIIFVFMGLSAVLTKLDDIHEDLKTLLSKKE